MKLLNFPKKIAWWYGTDALKLAMYPPGHWTWKPRIFLHRLFWRFAWRLFDFHFVNTIKTKPYLVEFGIPGNRIKEVEVPYEKKTYPKKAHDKFTILFHYPIGKFTKRGAIYKKWIYGEEYLNELKRVLKDVDWIITTGFMDMNEVYPVVDCYIKINRHRGSDINRIGKECLATDIPVLILDDYKQDFDTNIKKAVKWISAEKSIWLIKQKSKISRVDADFKMMNYNLTD